MFQGFWEIRMSMFFYKIVYFRSFGRKFKQCLFFQSFGQNYRGGRGSKQWILGSYQLLQFTTCEVIPKFYVFKIILEFYSAVEAAAICCLLLCTQVLSEKAIDLPFPSVCLCSSAKIPLKPVNLIEGYAIKNVGDRVILLGGGVWAI